MTDKMAPLLGRNERFAGTYTPVGIVPNTQAVIVGCLDHRVEPAAVLGVGLGDAPVIRNAGGRVTQAVIDDVVYLAYLIERFGGDRIAADGLFQVAILHHTGCGTAPLANPDFRREAGRATGIAEADLEAAAVADPYATVKADVERLLTAPMLSPKVGVSGHVFDMATGRVTTVVDARHP